MLERELDRLDGTLDAGAVAAWRSEENAFDHPGDRSLDPSRRRANGKGPAAPGGRCGRALPNAPRVSGSHRPVRSTLFLGPSSANRPDGPSLKAGLSMICAPGGCRNPGGAVQRGAVADHCGPLLRRGRDPRSRARASARPGPRCRRAGRRDPRSRGSRHRGAARRPLARLARGDPARSGTGLPRPPRDGGASGRRTSRMRSPRAGPLVAASARRGRGARGSHACSSTSSPTASSSTSRTWR